MSTTERLMEYAMAFEQAYAADDWSLIEPYFTEDAMHVSFGGGALDAIETTTGRDATIGGLQHAVESLDKRFETRTPELLEGPVVRDDGIWFSWRLTLASQGVPDLRIEGEHLTVYRGDDIAILVEHLTSPGGANIDAYMRTYGAQLKPDPHAAWAPDARMTAEEMLRAIEHYAGAKCRQDAATAMAECHEDFVLDVPTLGITVEGKEAVQQQLEAFFATFPDYDARVEGQCLGNETVVFWCTEQGTMQGPLLGEEPTGRFAAWPAASIYSFKDGRLAGERYFCSIASMCEQLGLSADALAEARRQLVAAMTA